MKPYSENELIEQPAIELFRKLGYKAENCLGEEVGEAKSSLGRRTTADVVLAPRLRGALKKLNADLPDEALDQAVEEISKDRSALGPVVANREVYKLLKDGVQVTFDEEGEARTERVQVIDWDDPANNDFFLASQFWVSGEMYKRRMDLVGFVNGIPLVLVELKATHKQLETAYSNNLRDYKVAVPQLFWYNALVILSNGSATRIGSMSAQWEHFAEWKRISDEQEKGVISLDTVIRGTCEKARLLDLLENFTIFTDIDGPLVKILAKNHQYLGVNNAIQALKGLKGKHGRLGVFWHTQGSGKSYSMMFFSQKVLRKMPGNWTFLVVTDRQELDGQIYKTFANAGAITEPEAQATNGDHLKRLLTEDHRYVFTLIQKFRIERGSRYPKLTERDDVIVITDEAHRTQYDTLAQNMRNALPQAAFLAFTGTPLIATEEKTRQVFGEYVSIYDFRQSIEDGATVPLYYENRIPELQLTNEHLKEDMEQLLEDAELDDAQQKKVEREFAREYHLVTRDDRLERISEDIVVHFIARGHRGKAMVVCIDKATAVRMYDKVQKHWKAHQARLSADLAKADEAQKAGIADTIAYMQGTDMAVVVSQGQNEIEDLKKKGLDIVPHRKRMVSEDLEKKFKDANDPFRIVFVCAMWMTGFDVPSCSTIYLDKPMRNHTLMQTIARANRVFREKVNGLIVDYIGVFRDLEKALAIYGSGAGGKTKAGESPVGDKSKLVATLRVSVKATAGFCAESGVSLEAIEAAAGFEKVKLLDDAVNAIIVSDESKRRYLSMAGDVVRLFKAILPDQAANEFIAVQAAIAVIAEKIKLLTPGPDISGVTEAVEKLLDESVAAQAYVIRQSVEEDKKKLIDLSKVNFEALKAAFEKGRKHIEAERLRAAVEKRLKTLLQKNRTRQDFMQKFQQLIEDYNAGAVNIDLFFSRLVEFAKDLSEEDKRSVKESLNEEELAIFDILMKPEMELTAKERNDVKKAARDLLMNLKTQKLVLDWRNRQQTRAEVKVAIETILDGELPKKFSTEMFEQKCHLIYEHVYDSYFGEDNSVYTLVG